ncbi:restriction endonuclease subunit S [Mycoplasma sp. 005V]|uniref:restriction endonuclease subunit S n=1 Tax=Mycoplasma sp. 005V TaxID=3398776 RepID=UPI003A83592C
MHAKKLVPQIRFKGFEEEWRYKILNELANKFDNLRIPVSEKLRKAGDIPYYGANGIQDYVSGYTHDGEFVLVAEDGANDLNNYPSKYVNGKFWANNHVHVIQGKENILDNKFLSFAIKNFNFKPLLTGGDRSKLNASALDIIQIKNPSIKEQEKIGLLFSSLDSLITSQELKLQKLQAVKQSLLDKMFASNNEKVPKIRFKAFHEQLELVTLKNILEYERPDKYIENSPLQKHGLIPVLTANKSFILGYSNENQKKYNKGRCIIFDDFTLDSKYVDFPFMVASSAIKILTPKSKSDNLYYYFCLLNKTTFENQGHARHYISIISNTKIYIPSKGNERELIGKLFYSIDTLITAQETKLEKLNNIKQGLLEKMFC